jgi:large subunit ribosomal protein L4
MAIAKKKTTVKKVTKAVKKTVAPKVVKEKIVVPKNDGLTAVVIGVDGKAAGKMTLPEELFGQKMNKQIVAQAVRVYQANQRQGGANTKTRGEVEGSTRKIYKQKGTGRARHGSIRAHIFVGGGIAFGPVTHDFTLKMPAKMKRKALAVALSSQYRDGNVVFMDGLETLEPKTKLVANALSNVGTGSLLLVLGKGAEKVALSARNIEGVDTIPAHSIHTYNVLSHKKIVFMKDAVNIIKEL